MSAAHPWRIGAVRIASTDGPVAIPGWTNDVFGLDWRGGADGAIGYVVTHLASGWAAFAILENLETVQATVDRFAALVPSWDGDPVAITLANRPAIVSFLGMVGAFSPNTLIAPAGHHDGRPVDA